MGLVDLIELDFDTPTSLPSLGIYKVGLHLIALFFAFVTFCIIVPIISIERAYTGSSQAAPNYTLVVTLISLFVATPLAFFPWSKYKTHLPTIRNFFLRPRTTVIFTSFLSIGWFVAMISMTVHGNNSSHCVLNTKLQKSDPSYVSAWMKQCNSAKAAAAFSWLSFFLWLATAVISVILLWHEKKLKHADQFSAAVTVSEAVTYDEDARTIVDMEYSEEDKQPVAHYDESTMSSAADISDFHEEEHRQESSHPLPIPPSSAPYQSCFTSPYVPNDPVAGSPVIYSAAPTNLVSPFAPNVGSPYSVPASVHSSSPYPPQQHQSPYIYNIQQHYSSMVMEQQQQQVSYHTNTPSPLAYNNPIVSHHTPYPSHHTPYPPHHTPYPPHQPVIYPPYNNNPM